MALQIEVAKASVKEQMDKLWNILLKLTCWPDGVIKEYPVVNIDGTIDLKNTIIYKDFSIRYRTGEDIADKEGKIQAMMQETIDDYKAEQVIFDHAKMDTIVTNLNNNLVG